VIWHEGCKRLVIHNRVLSISANGGNLMKTSIIAVLLSASLLAANVRASHHSERRGGDEPAAKASTIENVDKKEEKSIATPAAPISKPTQAQSKEEKRIKDIKNKLRQMGLARRVTVVLVNENERYGSIERIDEDSFQLAEVDLNQQVAILYKDIKKVRTGYGQFNPFSGKRVNPAWNLIAKIAVFAFLVIVVPLSFPRT
jgi:hypothetical protein